MPVKRKRIFFSISPFGKIKLFTVVKRRRRIIRPKKNQAEYLKYKVEAKKLVHAKLEQFNQHYQFEYGRVAIRNQSTRWGSCSRKHNLNFNYKIVLLKPEIADYVIVHELCHLKEFNHSKQFWELVAQTVPDYKALRKELKGIHT